MKLRVDWEPSSGTNGDGVFQVQSGSGKSGYSLDEYIEVNTISGRKSIEDWVNTNRQLRKLDTSTKEEIRGEGKGQGRGGGGTGQRAGRGVA